LALEVVLISPKYLKKETLSWNLSYALEEASKMWKQPIRSPSYPLALPLIASLIQKVKKDCNIQIIDENVHEIDFSNIKPDLICITANTLQVERSFQIANSFREKNPEVKVLLGGAHFRGSTKTDEIIKEALNYADSIVIGESDNLWKEILNDFEQKRLKDTYQCDNVLQLDKLVLPRFDLLPLESYLFRNLEASRGCNRRCSFCNVKTHLRFKEANNVIEEIKYLRKIEHVKRIEHRSIFFTDNIFNPENPDEINKVKELMEKLIQYKEKKYLGDEISWSGQVSSKIGMEEFDDLLNLMVRAGAKRLLIGFESFYFEKDPLNKEKYPPKEKKERFLNSVKKVRDKGIDVIASFMVGFDNEPDSILKEIYYFINESGLVLVQVTVLTPFPGTKDFKRLREEGRLLKKDGHYEWNKYDCTNFVYKFCVHPKNIKNKQLEYYKLFKKIYNNNAIENRIRIRQKALPYEPKELFSEKLIIKSFQKVAQSLN